MIGAHQANNRGAAYVFEYVGNIWVQKAKLTPNDPDIFQAFGVVSISGTTATLVGSTARAASSRLF